MDKILNMVIGNPLTGIPGAIGICALAGPALTVLGGALTQIGSGVPFWTVLTQLASDPHISGFIMSLGLVVAKDHNQ